MKNEQNDYSYFVIWSEEDQEYVGLCAEFPSLSYLAVTPEEALEGIRQIVIAVDVDLKGDQRPIPLNDEEQTFWQKASESSLQTIWDNDEDDIYARLFM
ncbi:MAG: hypothetical protein KA314_10705 [Chloroflexi bacterium]|nr:hypothetical protein [Chloroflexota bacterium]MBP8056304.1 hypothetical protein [Chloroflexota bacterium]